MKHITRDGIESYDNEFGHEITRRAGRHAIAYSLIFCFLVGAIASTALYCLGVWVVNKIMEV